jgi:prophage tail gpP-like protein
VLSAPDYDQAPLYSLFRTDNQSGSVRNNIIDATAERDYSRFPTHTLFDAKATTGGDNPKPLRKEIETLKFAESIGGEIAARLTSYVVKGRRLPKDSAELPDGMLYRLLYMKDEVSRNPEQLLKAASRAFTERFKDTLTYTATVPGFRDKKSGALWAVNTMVQVNDVVLGVNEPLWIESREFSFSPSAGAVTRLTCWKPGAFQP